jgi:probable DNA metabolism protein
MVSVPVSDYGSWRHAARGLLSTATPPDEVLWLADSEQAPLPYPTEAVRDIDDVAAARGPRVPRSFHVLAELVACHRSNAKWGALYRLLWRVVHEGRHVLDQDADPDIRAVSDMAAQVGRDEHKMRAFVRFVPVSDEGETRYVAWYEPDHLIVRRAAPFFADRFASMRWSILTPDDSVHWDGHALSFSDGAAAPPTRNADDVEGLWRVYYQSVFNPARLNTRAMLREMPAKRWHLLPEASLIPGLVRTAREDIDRLSDTKTTVTARPFVPATDDLAELGDAASACRGCRLHEAATQVVFGEGPVKAHIVVVGEQPGDAEDLAGRPFVGPAGEILDRALAAAGIDRDHVYVTNAVKHFSFEPRGKRRIHQTPRLSEMHACRPWLEAELRIIRPATVIALGATAARSLLGPQARVMALRGRVLENLPWAPRVIVTVHPSAVLRAQGEGDRYFEMLVADLELAAGASPRRDAGHAVRSAS